MKKQFFKVWMACMLMGFPFMAWAQTNETLVAAYSLTRYVDDSPGDEDDGSPEYPWRAYIPNFDTSVYQDGHYYRLELTFTVDEEEGEERTQTLIITQYIRQIDYIPIGDGGEYFEDVTEYFDLDNEEGIYFAHAHLVPEYDDATLEDLNKNTWMFEYWLAHPWNISDVVLRIYDVQQ